MFPHQIRLDGKGSTELTPAMNTTEEGHKDRHFNTADKLTARGSGDICSLCVSVCISLLRLLYS